jgi:nitrate reductase cytochrome c-type subunit
MRTERFVPFFVAALILVLSVTAASAHKIQAGVKFEDPAQCGECHKAIYEEWMGSMHAKSSKSGDPVHAAVHDAFSKAMVAAGKPVTYFCATCHAPTADNMALLMKGEVMPDPENPSNTRSVTCSFCHKVDGVVEGERFNTYNITSGIKGKVSTGNSPHGVIASEVASSYLMCMGCHGKMINAKGGVICSADEEGYSDCLKCHMTQADGAPAPGSAKATHAFHGIYGGHDPEMLKKGATITLGSELGRLLVMVHNPNPHFFPSTNPMRVAFVKVEIFDENGGLLFTNFTKDASEDPQALFMKVFKAGDKVGVASWDADGVAKDTRLHQNEERALTYVLPEEAAKATAKLYYRFVPAPAIEKFGIKPDGTVEKAQLVDEASLEF